MPRLFNAETVFGAIAAHTRFFKVAASPSLPGHLKSADVSILLFDQVKVLSLICEVGIHNLIFSV